MPREFSSGLKLYIVILTTLVLPILLGLWLQNYDYFRFVSIPLHSFIEGTGALAAMTMALIVFIMYSHERIFISYHRASISLISMGVFDAFHAMVYPGELFVWLHSIAVFFGGLLFAFVWLPDYKVSKKNYSRIPFLFFTLSVLISVLSLLFPSFVPQMLTKTNEFTNFANFLNLVGGVMFVIASFYYIKEYLEHEDFDDLLFAGHTLLFGTAGVLFFFSNMWDSQWWLWHFLRFVAYMIALVYTVKLFYKSLLDTYRVNVEYSQANEKLQQTLQILKEYKRAYSESGIVSIGDLKGNIIYANEEMLQKTGYKLEEILGKPHSIFRDKSTPKQTFVELWETIQNQHTWKGMLKNRKKDGSSFYINLTVIPIVDENGHTVEYLGLRDDITQLVRSQKELQKHFYTDTLTSLYNRVKLIDDISKTENPLIIVINLNNFKTYNDFFGSKFGDELIIKVSDILLKESQKSGYKIYRNHADEFVALKNYDYDAKDVYVEQAINFIKHVNNRKINIANEEINLSSSCGISLGYSDLLHVDLALKEAKKSKKEYVIYHESLTVYDEYKQNIMYSKILKDAINNERVIAEFQPIYNIHTKAIEKYEALIRIVDKNNKIIYPNNFLKISKQIGLYHELTKRVVKKAINLASKSDYEISMNITADDILDVETSEFILNTLRNISYCDRLVFEIVESEGIENFESVQNFILNIKNLGCKVAIDDFGTGYSNFDYLIKLQADYIKIDGSLVKNIDVDKDHYAIVETIVEFAKKNSLKTVAEFVHSQEILDKLNVLGIDYAQGFFIGRPSKEIE